MKMNYKHLGMYVLTGIISACLTIPVVFGWDSAPFKYGWDPVKNSAFFFMGSIWLAISILVVGDSVSGMRCRSDWFSPLIFITLCFIGWWIAGTYAHDSVSIHFECTWFCDPEVIWSGGIGGIFVGAGLALTWKVRRIAVVMITTTLAGLLGGLILSQVFGAFLMFLIWQPILLLGIGIAVQIDSAKSSAEQ